MRLNDSVVITGPFPSSIWIREAAVKLPKKMILGYWYFYYILIYKFNIILIYIYIYIFIIIIYIFNFLLYIDIFEA